LGWKEGRNYAFEFRWPGSDPAVRAAAEDMVRSAPDVIVVGSLVAACELRKQSTAESKR